MRYSLILLIQLLFLVFNMMVITNEWFISLVCLTPYVRYWNLKISKLNGSVFVTILLLSLPGFQEEICVWHFANGCLPRSP